MGTKSFYGSGQGSFYGGGMYGNGQSSVDFIEKTIGPASIAFFNDGLKNEPLKECIVDIDLVQDLHGYDNPWPAGGGKNKLDDAKNKRYFATGNIYFGGATGQSGTPSCSLQAGTYTFSVETSDGTNTNLYVFSSDGTRLLDPVYNKKSITFTLSQSTEIIVRVYSASYTNINDITTAQIESGSTATAYAPYSNVCPITGHTVARVMKSGKNFFQKPYDITKPAMFLTDWYGTSIDGDWIVQTGHSVGIGGFGGAVTQGLKKGTYTLSFDVDATNAINGQYSVTLWMIDIFGTIITSRIGNNFTNNYFYRTIKFNEDIDAFAVRVTSSGSSDTAIVKYKNIQLELGSTATSYEPYAGQTYSIEFPLLSKNLADMREENIKLGYYITTNGAETAHSSNFIYNQYIPVKANTSYTISMSSPVYFISISEYSSADRNGFIIRKAGGTGSNTKFTITTGDSTKYIRFGSNVKGSSGEDLTMQEVLSIDWMFEEGSTASDYEPYTSTVYGGSLDVTNGILTVNRAMVDMGTLTWAESSILPASGGKAFYTPLSDIGMKAREPHTPNTMYSSIYVPALSEAWSVIDMLPNQIFNNRANLFVNAQYEDATLFTSAMNKVQLCYQLATPVTYQLTPVEVSTLLGTNNIWADTGDTTVKYLAKK